METEKQYASQERERAKELKEQEIDPELAKASAMERADLVAKEVKTNKKQLQNIALHMQQVLTAIQAIRQQLELRDDVDDPMSVQQDKEKMRQLKEKIALYIDEVEHMKNEVIRGMIDDLVQQQYPAPYEELERIAGMRYDALLEEMKKE